MFRPKPQNFHFSDTTKNRDLTTKMQNTAKNRKITNKAISVNESDSEDSDYEYDIPLMHIKDGLKGWCDSSPIGQRTRSRVSQNKILRCENGKEEWDLDDYERWESKECKEVKIVSNYREPGVMPLSPHAFTKTMSLSGKRNVKSTKLQKKNGIKSSTPIRPSMPKSKELELSPILKSTDSLNVYDWESRPQKAFAKQKLS